MRLAVEHHRLTNNGWVRSETALPKRVTQNHNVVLPEDFLFRRKNASLTWHHPEHGENICRSLSAGYTFWLASPRDIKACRAEGGDSFERLVSFSPYEEVGHGRAEVH